MDQTGPGEARVLEFRDGPFGAVVRLKLAVDPGFPYEWRSPELLTLVPDDVTGWEEAAVIRGRQFRETWRAS